jgi:hypothetical protein
MLRDKYVNTEILIMGDLNCRTGEEQIKLLHLFHFREDWMVDKENFSEKDIVRIRVAMWKGKKLIEFCELNNFEMLNGKF